MKLKLVGNYKELPHGDKQGESLYGLISTVPCLNEYKIINYLKAGKVFSTSTSLAYDALSKDEIIIGGLSMLTDNVWGWASDLAYYVEKYHISIDRDFVRHMENNRWNIDKDSIDLRELDRRLFPIRYANTSERLKRVGFFRELDYGDEDGGSIRGIISTVPSLYEDKIIKYLESGRPHSTVATSTKDVLSRAEKYIGMLQTLTDGIWIWPADLIYYAI